MSTAALLALLIAAEPVFELAPIQLSVALVNDPDFPALEPELAKKALALAATEFARRFNVPAPELTIVNELSLSGFLGAYALPVDPRCKPLYEARYRGKGAAELTRFKVPAKKFLERWPLESLQGFVETEFQSKVKNHDDIYEYYTKKYVRTIDSVKDLKTPTGAPLVEPDKSARRSFVAWTCALLRQKDYDVILTNTFILADLLSEPHPHSVFGKAKIGGIAARSPGRKALDGQALLATTFGIDTRLPAFVELPGDAPTFEERAEILGMYLLAHEIAHAVFGIPDVFDHPEGCLMTTRPGATYRDGLKELAQHQTACPKCRPYVEARSLLDRAQRLYDEKKYSGVGNIALRAAQNLPKHFHGGRKRRMAQVMVVAAKAYFALGKTKEATSFAKAAIDLDPASEEAAGLFHEVTLASSERTIGTSSTATTTASPAR
jgi:hypothetical protein